MAHADEAKRDEELTRRAVERMLERFHHLGERVQAFEGGAKDFDTGHNLYRAETHTLQAIGQNDGLNMTELAAHMNVTKSAASQVVSKLVEKNLVSKETAPHSGREVRLTLTSLGWKGYKAHERFHAQMFGAVHDYFGDSIDRGVRRLTTAIDDLIGIVDAFARRVGS